MITLFSLIKMAVSGEDFHFRFLEKLCRICGNFVGKKHFNVKQFENELSIHTNWGWWKENSPSKILFVLLVKIEKCYGTKNDHNPQDICMVWTQRKRL